MSPFESSKQIYLVNVSEESVFCVFISCNYKFFSFETNIIIHRFNSTFLTTRPVIHGEFPLIFIPVVLLLILCFVSPSILKLLFVVFVEVAKFSPLGLLRVRSL